MKRDYFNIWSKENEKEMDNKDKARIIKFFEAMDNEKAYAHRKFFETHRFTNIFSNLETYLYPKSYMRCKIGREFVPFLDIQLFILIGII